MPQVAGFAVALLLACGGPPASQVTMECRWVMYGTETDSFVFDLKGGEVYWINEDKRYPITELNEGRLGFSGVRSELRVSEAEVLRDVQVSYSVNRVTGELYVSGIDLPSGYENRCAATEPLF